MFFPEQTIHSYPLADWNLNGPTFDIILHFAWVKFLQFVHLIILFIGNYDHVLLDLPTRALKILCLDSS
jgi:hypothetical protein